MVKGTLINNFPIFRSTPFASPSAFDFAQAPGESKNMKVIVPLSC